MKSLLNDDTEQYLRKIDYGRTWSVSHHMRFLMIAHYIVHNQLTTVLDVGFGKNVLINYLQDAGFKGTYLGIDLNQDYINAAIESVKDKTFDFSIEYKYGDMSALEKSDMFECIVLGEVIEHVPLEQANEFMVACKEHMSWPFGSIVLTTPNKQNDTITWPDDHDHEFSLAELTALCESAGFRVADVFGLWNNSDNTFAMLNNMEKKVYTHLEMCVPKSLLNVFYNMIKPEKSKAVLLILTHRV